MRLGDVGESFDESLRSKRPEDNDLRAAEWDRDLGVSYSSLERNMAWLHLVENMRIFRGDAVTRLVNGEDGASEWRKVILMIDSILAVSTAMKETGTRSKEWLEGRSDYDG